MTPDNKAVADLAAQWWPLTVRTARRCAAHWRVPHLADEFESAAGEAVLRGVRRFLEREGDPTRPAVGTFVGNAVRWECYRVLQAERPERAKSLDAELGTEGGTIGAVLAADCDNDPAELAERNEAAELVRAYLDRAALTAFEREAVLRRFGDGPGCKSLAAERGCSYQNVYQAVAHGLRKLRAVAGVRGAPTHLKRRASRPRGAASA